MHYYGAILLFVSALWLGLLRVNHLRRRPRLMRELADTLLIIEREICCHMTPLPDAFLQAGQASRDSAFFFQMLYYGMEANFSLTELWPKAVERLPFLDLQEQQAVRNLCNTLGSDDPALQRNSLERCVDELRKGADAAQENVRSRAKLTLGLSLTCGLMSLILLC